MRLSSGITTDPSDPRVATPPPGNRGKWLSEDSPFPSAQGHVFSSDAMRCRCGTSWPEHVAAPRQCVESMDAKTLRAEVVHLRAELRERSNELRVCVTCRQRVTFPRGTECRDCATSELPACSRCGEARRVTSHRWCAGCKQVAQRRYNAKKRAEAEALRAEVSRLKCDERCRCSTCHPARRRKRGATDAA